MTLISITHNYNRPIIIGDILTTSLEKGKEVEIPSFLSSVEGLLPKNQDYFPYQLRQKIYIIKDRLAIALAGNVYQMTLFLIDLKDYFEYYEVTEENYRKFISEYDLSSINECAILICIIENDKLKFNQYHYGNWLTFKHEMFETVMACGSGASNFIKLIKSSKNYSGKQYNPVAINLSILSNLLTDERFTLNSILNAWGAGFEMIECSKGIFKKVDDLTFVIWKGKVNEKLDDIEGDPILILHYKYVNDVLIIRSYSKGEIKGYGVLPLYMKKEEINENDYPNNVDFVSTKVISTYVLEDLKGNVYFPTFYTEPNDGIETIKVNVESNGSIEILMRQDKIQDMINDIITSAK